MRSLLILCLLFGALSAAKVAVFLNAMSNSHVIFTIRVAEELAQDHDVVIIRPNVNPSASKIVSKHPRVREIRTNGVTEETFKNYKKIEKNMVWAEPSMSDYMAMSGGYQAIFAGICQDFTSDDAILALLRAEKFDFALAHHLDLCPVSIIHALDIPGYGFMLSVPLVRSFVNLVGIPMLPSIYPALLADSSNQMNFWQRFKTFLLETMMSTLAGRFQAKPIDDIMRAKFGEEFPGVMDLAKDAKFLLANVHPDIEYPVPVTSKVTYFGGLGMSNESKPLEEPYLSFVEKAKTVVFVSFGTVADPKMMPASWKNAFVELFERNPDVAFIWRMENDVAVPKNVLRNTWHPQNDILAHTKTAAFITHAGYNSLGESIASGTPLITVPLFGDQFRNSRLAEYRGFGVRVDKMSMDFETLNEALHRILDNPSYEKSAQSLRKIVFSSPVKAGDALRHAVNFAIEHPDHLFLLFGAASAAKVAVFLSPLSNSHVIFTLRVADELAQDHDVVIIRPNINPKASTLVSEHPRVSEIRTSGASLESFTAFKEVDQNLVWSDPSFSDFRAMGRAYGSIFTEVCTNIFNDDDVIARLRDEKFDFALAHHLDFCPLAVIEAIGIPGYGFLLSTPLLRHYVNLVGIPMLPSIYPSLMMDAGNEMGLVQRIKNFLFEVAMARIGSKSHSAPIDNITRTKYGQDFPGSIEIAEKAKFLLSNVHPDIEFPVPVTSKVTYFGGLGMSNESRPLEEPYLSFVEKAKTVVFVSFGTVADPKKMPASWKNAFVELFEKNPDVSFIWRMENDVEVPKNVLRNTWHPQNDILAHPKTAAFITHAGYNSIGESVASGTPLITVPLFADQFRNSRLAEYRGFGVRVEKASLSFETLNTALQEVLSNPSYEKAAQSLRKIVFSSPVKAGDALRHAVNFAIEHPNHNRNLPNLSFIALYSLDVIAILSSIVLFIIVAVLLVLWKLWRCIRSVRLVKEKKL